MSRSRARLAADWFAKLRQNAVTQEVEHTDVVAAEATATAAIQVELDAKAPLDHNHISEGSFTVGGSASTYYPVIFERHWGCKILIWKHVHNYATWDGLVTFQIDTHPYGWGGYASNYFVRQNVYSNRAFVHSAGGTGDAGSYVVVYLLGGGRTYQYATSGLHTAGGLWGGPYYTTTALTNNGTVGPTTSAASQAYKTIS
jgi:hypothetical protein